MPIRKVPVAEATAGQLRAFAMTVLGVDDIPQGLDKAAVLARIEPIFKLPEITLFEEASGAKVDENGNARRTEKIVNGRTYVLMTLHRGAGGGGNEPKFVGVNGRAMFIPRGKPVWVPEEYVEVLENAVEYLYEEYDADKDLMGGLKTPQLVHANPFSLN